MLFTNKICHLKLKLSQPSTHYLLRIQCKDNLTRIDQWQVHIFLLLLLLLQAELQRTVLLVQLLSAHTIVEWFDHFDDINLYVYYFILEFINKKLNSIILILKWDPVRAEVHKMFNIIIKKEKTILFLEKSS